MATSSGPSIILLVVLISLQAFLGIKALPSSHASVLTVKPPGPPPPSPRPSPHAPNLFSSPPSPFPLPAGRIVTIHDEVDLAQAIAAATGSSTTTLRMPPLLYLTKALPNVTGLVQLINANDTAVVVCTASGFSALRILASSFGMRGITWTSCTSVMDVSSVNQVTIDGCSFLNGGSGLNQVRMLTNLQHVETQFALWFIHRITQDPVFGFRDVHHNSSNG